MNVDFADEEMIAYRESLIEKKKEQPFWKKKCLSVNETAAYTGIGRGKIRELMKRKDCNFMTTDGYQVYVIIDKFVEFLNSRNEIYEEQPWQDQNEKIKQGQFFARENFKEVMEVISTVGLMKTIKEDMFIQKRLKHSGLKRKRLRKTKVMA